MMRRRRPVREIPFSFDSFLDIVANVVGIIIRLILVVWVGARSYSSLQETAHRPAAPREAAGEAVPEPDDPLRDELARHRRDLADAQARLLEQLRQLHQVEESQGPVRDQLVALEARSQGLEQEKVNLDRAAGERERGVKAAALSLGEIQQRSRQLADEIRDLEKLPPLTKVLRYHTPVSRPVNSEEILFECQNGRVTFLDIGALLGEVRRDLEEKVKLLHTRWQVSDVTEPAGAFRLRYVVERQRGMLDAAMGEVLPEANAPFRCGLSEWQAEPVALVRGEPAEKALADGSDFRQIIDSLDPQQAVVTFWVYPNSFALYRQLRDYLYERDIVVAGRPLPDGYPIASSRHGTVSRGQ